MKKHRPCRGSAADGAHSYWRFVASNRRFLAFGFIAAFGSSFGQTFFIGLFGPHLQREFGLSHTAWGTIYLAGTLASAALLPWTGKLIDRVELSRYATFSALALAAACFFFSLVSGPLTLVLAIFALRHTGQGLASHIAMTSMARYFRRQRGRAIALATAGFSAGEALLPLAAVLCIGVVGWRLTYAGIAIALLIAAAPLLLWLLKGHASRAHSEHKESASGPAAHPGITARSWSRSEVLRDRRFYLLLPAVSGLSIIGTALFFHHLNIADAKGWSHEWVTGSYAVYSIATVLTAFAAGIAVDRLGATRLVPAMPLPLLLALVVVASFEHHAAVWLYFALFGLSSGLYFISVTAMWAELYGVGYLGSIKAMVASLGVFGSALGPVLMGGLMDLGLAVTDVCLLFGAYMGVAGLLAAEAVRRGAGGGTRETGAGTFGRDVMETSE